MEVLSWLPWHAVSVANIPKIEWAGGSVIMATLHAVTGI